MTRSPKSAEYAHEDVHLRTGRYSRRRDSVNGQEPDARFIGGGTNLLDLMKLQIEAPSHLIDLQDLKLGSISALDSGGLRIGALVSNTDLASHERIRRDYSLVTRAIVAGASGQLRADRVTAWRIVRPSIALPPRRVLWLATWGVTLRCRQASTKSRVS